MSQKNKTGIRQQWRQWAKRLKSEVLSLYFAYKDPRVPWYAKLFIIVIVGYALSPIDLIPDFIPILGYLDDFLLLPLGVAAAIRMIPPAVMEEARGKARASAEKPVSRMAAVVIVMIWLTVLAWLISILR